MYTVPWYLRHAIKTTKVKSKFKLLCMPIMQYSCNKKMASKLHNCNNLTLNTYIKLICYNKLITLSFTIIFSKFTG